jgi:hypothetical protein
VACLPPAAAGGPAGTAEEMSGIQPAMAEETVDVATRPEAGLRNYRAPWKGQIVLVCRKCQKKLKHGGKKKGIAKLGKELRKRTRHNEEALQLRVIEVSCLKLCPQQQLGRNQCCIVRTPEDIDALLGQTLEPAV